MPTMTADEIGPLTPRRLRSVKACPATLTALLAVGVITGGAPSAHAGTEIVSAAAPIAAAALIVGGTSFPTLQASMMAEMWPIWANSLGLENTSATKLISVPYPAQLFPLTSGDSLGVSVAAGSSSLLALIGTTYAAGDKLVLWGISQGAMVLGAAQAVLAKDSSAPPASALTFVEVANPAAPRTGLLNFLPRSILLKVLHCTTGLCSQPSDSQYNTVMVINQYDGFADFPTKPWNVLAELNALVGLYYRHGQTGGADLTTVPAPRTFPRPRTPGAPPPPSTLCPHPSCR